MDIDILCEHAMASIAHLTHTAPYLAPTPLPECGAAMEAQSVAVIWYCHAVMKANNAGIHAIERALKA